MKKENSQLNVLINYIDSLESIDAQFKFNDFLEFVETENLLHILQRYWFIIEKYLKVKGYLN